MGRWIRWQGVVAFAALVALIAGFWLLLADRIVKAGIEAAGTRAVGARVDVDGADLSLSPAGLILTRIQVTNPDAPTTNAVEIARVAMTFDGAMLLRRKVIVEEMSVEGLRLNTPRQRSGAVRKAPPPPREERTAPLGLELPDPDALLKDAGQESARAAEALKADLAAFRESWEKQLAELPDEARLEAYRERAKALKQAGKGGIGGLLGAAKDAKSLADDLRHDRKAVRDARERLQSEAAALQARRKALEAEPAAEARRMVEQFAKESGLGGATSALALADRVGGWVSTARDWYRRLLPYFDRARAMGAEGAPKPPRGAGEDIRFPDVDPVPDFLLRKADLSVSLRAGDLHGTLADVSSDPALVGRPAVLSLSGDRLEGVDRVAVDATFDHVRPQAVTDRVAVTVDGYRADNLAVIPGGPVPITLARGNVGLAVNAAVADGDRLSGKIALSTRDATVDATGPPAVVSAVQGIHAIGAQATLGGTLANPTVSVSTDLDRVLGEAAAAAARGRLGALEATLRDRLTERLTQRLAGMDTGGLGNDIATRLAERLQGLEQVLAGIPGAKS